MTRAEYDHVVSALQHALGAEALAMAWQEGRQTTLEQAIAEALITSI